MKYQATLSKQAHEIEVKEKGEGIYEVLLDGEKHLVDALQLDHGAVSLIVDHASYSVEFEDSADGLVNVLVRDQVFPVEVLDERRLRMRAAGGRFAVEGPQTVVAPMPGKVVKILCKVGDEVKEGQGLVVVEAMKMENELASPKDGVIKEIVAVENTSVESGAKLVVVE
ncbi:biotin/lipoyl-containing protein [Vulgatibacter sp.]|uniref:biotin/lipoyl-containing protein n=1 Tax=Vulgatibacter sp. TaxID=1971226 RepID=UPI003566072C